MYYLGKITQITNKVKLFSDLGGPAGILLLDVKTIKQKQLFEKSRILAFNIYTINHKMPVVCAWMIRFKWDEWKSSYAVIV